MIRPELIGLVGAALRFWRAWGPLALIRAGLAAPAGAWGPS